ncbi:UDP-N-acetylmuramate dehydrogenase [Paraneptunicella aestuarii]|nr:UDP-N-acetylmuramate dehydrogenase [Paraneptunicella aestuarii]
MADSISEIRDESLLSRLPVFDTPFIILGEGTNMVFVEDFSGSILNILTKGVEIKEQENQFLISVKAGENWHCLVESLLDKGIYGLENMALIPGSVGAAPVQNIGAYGIEFKDMCHSVTTFDIKRKTWQTYTREECCFGYRDSIFKSHEKQFEVITEVALLLPKTWNPNLNYRGLDTLPLGCAAKDVFNRVVEIRQQKLPDPKKIGNAGSFFKNPIISFEKFKSLQEIFPDMPFFNAENEDGKIQNAIKIKVPAAWLIEQCGFKGKHFDGIGCHQNQPLVLVNKGSGSGVSLLTFAREIRSAVLQRFGIQLENEVRLIGRNGVISL